ncbi:hypothetical protein Tco_0761421 [Tanacetum coccineum]
MLLCVHYEFMPVGTSNRATKSKYNTNLARLLLKQIYAPCIVDWGVLNNMGCAEEIEEMLEINVYELCHEFYATYEFDETITDEDLMSKKLIKFRLGGRGHTLTILEFSRHLGLYTSDEIHDEGFETYSLGGLRNDDHFNVNYLVDCKVAEEEKSWKSEGEHDLLMGRMEIRQGELEKMSGRQSYHSDRYAGLFEYMDGHYDVPLQGAYAPHGYDEPQQHQQDEE